MRTYSNKVFLAICLLLVEVSDTIKFKLKIRNRNNYLCHLFFKNIIGETWLSYFFIAYIIIVSEILFTEGSQIIKLRTLNIKYCSLHFLLYRNC